MRIYVYKCVNDDGGAPCIDHGRLSLTICKPGIRRRAKVSDYIFAFGANSESPANRLVYIARITKRVESGEYFTRPEYRDRADCIYEQLSAGSYVRRRNARFHNSETAIHRDLGAPPRYLSAVSLISDDFRYFGGNGVDDWKAMAPKLRLVVERLGQGHRVNHIPAVHRELLAIADFAWRTFRRKVNGPPQHAASNNLIQITFGLLSHRRNE